MDVPSISPKQSQQPSLDPKKVRKLERHRLYRERQKLKKQIKNGSSLQGPEDFESNSDVDIEETNCDEPAETQSEDATLRKYLLPYEWVEMPPEEQRALFDQSEKDLRFRRLHKEKPPLQGSMCTVCAGNGHIGSGCPELLVGCFLTVFYLLVLLTSLAALSANTVVLRMNTFQRHAQPSYPP
jgi:hypothetical protein